MLRLFLTASLMLFHSFSSAWADSPVILKAKAVKTAPDTYRFSVTVKHADTGWKHYVNKWDVVTMDGKVLGSRKLWHPHVEEQPFTRSLNGVKIPANITEVRIRVHDNVHGYGGATFKITLKK